MTEMVQGSLWKWSPSIHSTWKIIIIIMGGGGGSGHKEGISFTMLAYSVMQAPQPAKVRDQCRGHVQVRVWLQQWDHDRQMDRHKDNVQILSTSTPFSKVALILPALITLVHYSNIWPHFSKVDQALVALLDKTRALSAVTGHPSPRLTRHLLHR